MGLSTKTIGWLEERVNHRRARGRLVVLSALVLCSGMATVLPAQTIGEEAELDRLQARAEESMANGDAEGAAMSMGRAALMASQVGKRFGDQPKGLVYRAAETFFRAQEQGYRALALFHRAGGQAPASSGVCHTLRSAHFGLRKALASLNLDEQALQDLSPPDTARFKQLRISADDWTTVLASMTADFQCLEPSPSTDHPPD